MLPEETIKVIWWRKFLLSETNRCVSVAWFFLRSMPSPAAATGRQPAPTTAPGMGCSSAEAMAGPSRAPHGLGGGRGGTEQLRREGRGTPRGIWWAVIFDRATERCLAAYLLLRASGSKRISFRAKCDFVLCVHLGQQGVEWKTRDVSSSCSPEFPYNRP